MAERTPRVVEEEDLATRYSWTGDVWRLLPALKKYRPDLRIQQFDCGPTGLMVCSLLDPYSRILSENYGNIVNEFISVELSEFGIVELWALFPTISSRILSGNPASIPKFLFNLDK